MKVTNTSSTKKYSWVYQLIIEVTVYNTCVENVIMRNGYYLPRPHLVSICVAVSGSIHKASWKLCGFFLPGTDP